MREIASHPVLSLEEAKAFEASLFRGEEALEWAAMQKAGAAVGAAVLADYLEIGAFPPGARILVLLGKGHNGGDALLAAKTILLRVPGATADVVLLFGERALRPLAARAYRELFHAVPERVRLVSSTEIEGQNYSVSLDGIFGFQFRPPFDSRTRQVFEIVDRLDVDFRAAVDLPSGLGDSAALSADFTYATGSVKGPCLESANGRKVGRLRYLDLGFFDGDAQGLTLAKTPEALRVLAPSILRPLRKLRDPQSDKRSHGHLFVVAGSRHYPGAALMSILSAVRSGTGFVTAFVPESLVPAFAARVPEAIFVGWPETPDGGLALEGFHLLRERLDRATALLVGPGMGREPETLALVSDIAKSVTVPFVADADALQAGIVEQGSAPRILTPHAGEFARVAGQRSLESYCRDAKAITVLKGPHTRISDGKTSYVSCAGGPILARGGSGDILGGLIGGLLAQTPDSPLACACRGVAWQGRAADLWARNCGQVAVSTTQLLDFLPQALREG
jgi:NAD(P)H-hydrate epimerase